MFRDRGGEIKEIVAGAFIFVVDCVRVIRRILRDADEPGFNRMRPERVMTVEQKIRVKISEEIFTLSETCRFPESGAL